ncbi:MAG: cytochrome c3 family protein [Myxococcales bacterium]|nr:cytochrome c3 family protein [Myxococcales bacterium]MDH5306352.1 cytochrome c3 family protein [Myxococcales bacterium]MDH5565145.1 cytochrome c3 family protein [Myxococcales bacterium]
MRRRTLLRTLLAALAGIGAAAPPEPAPQPFVPSAALREFLEARAPSGEPIIAADQLAYFEGLPAREKQRFDAAVGLELIGAPTQLQEILSLGLRAGPLDLLLHDNCLLCHTNPEEQDAETLFSIDPEARGSPSHLQLGEFVSDVHFRKGLSCAGCHGGSPDVEGMVDEIYERWPESPARHTDRTWIPAFCARCHANPLVMRRFNPGLPTDQYAKYRESRHGQRLLDHGDSKAAQCVSCHGVHGIRDAKSPRSKVHPRQVPGTCGACHADAAHMAGYRTRDGKPLPTNQLADYEQSVHGRALLERGDLGAPACNDCHGNHAALPPEIASIAEVCRTCHAANGELFDGSEHKRAFERNGWPECAQCHGNHAIAKTADSMLNEAENSLCYACHRQHAADNPRCIETARYFYDSITTLATETASFESEVHALAERGLDDEPLSIAVEELHETLQQSRSRIHAFNRSEFDAVADRGRAVVEKSRTLIANSDAEYRFRRNGLLIAIALTGLLALLLYAKIRQIESNEPPRS